MDYIYHIEHNGDQWQSVFPSYQADNSQLHDTIEDALTYMVDECQIDPLQINIVPRYIKVKSRSFLS